MLDHNGVIRFKNTRGKALDAAVETLLAAAEQAAREESAETPGADTKEADF